MRRSIIRSAVIYAESMKHDERVKVFKKKKKKISLSYDVGLSNQRQKVKISEESARALKTTRIDLYKFKKVASQNFVIFSKRCFFWEFFSEWRYMAVYTVVVYTDGTHRWYTQRESIDFNNI